MGLFHDAAALLQPLVARCESDVGLKLTIHVKPKAEDGTEQMNALVEAMKAAGDEPKVGVLPRDKHTGKVRL